MAAVQATLRGVNAAVVGLLVAAFYTPVWTGGIRSGVDFGVGLAAFLLLVFWRVPPWIVVVLGAVSGAGVFGLSGAPGFPAAVRFTTPFTER